MSRLPARRALGAALVVLAALAAPARSARAQEPGDSTSVLIECGRWFDGTAMHEGPTRVLVEKGRIARIGPGL
ncbi:MAG TPA: hypothetical protein VL503_08530, partial [Candidatus Omnitrophota bacterium]|nr:hypothetical protein [Candidatus Omnitrophota bacterium]